MLPYATSGAHFSAVSHKCEVPKQAHRFHIKNKAHEDEDLRDLGLKNSVDVQTPANAYVRFDLASHLVMTRRRRCVPFHPF